MNTGAFGENFPYSNFHDLNMDWIIKIAKDFLDQYTHIQETIENGEASLTETTNNGIAELTQKYDDIVVLLNQWYQTHSEDIENELASAIASFYSAADDKMARLLQEIPTEYGDLSNDVRALRASIPNATNLDIYPHWLDNRSVLSDGSTAYSNRRIATDDYVDCSTSTIINYTIEEGYRLYLAFYDVNHTYLNLNTGWLTGSGTYNLQLDMKYWRAQLARVTESAENPVTVATDAYRATINQNYALIRKSLFDHGGLGINDDLNNIYTIGMYRIDSLARENQPANCPNDFDGGTLMVIPAFRNLSNVIDQSMLQQILFNGTVGQIYIRYCSATLEWRAWKNMSDIINPQMAGSKTRWLAVGDSITAGVYSYIEDGESHTSTTRSWCARLAESCHYDMTLMASRGMGYTDAITGIDPEGGDTRISLSTLLTRIEAMTDDFNLVTIAFGINDYNTPSVATLDTIEAGVINAISRIGAKFPNARVVVITPFNCCRRGDTSTNYAFNYPLSGRSLKDVADRIKSVCDSQGVECFYATQGCLFTNYNITTLQPDTVHPSLDGQILIGKSLAHILRF